MHMIRDFQSSTGETPTKPLGQLGCFSAPRLTQYGPRGLAANADAEDRLILILSAFLPLGCAEKSSCHLWGLHNAVNQLASKRYAQQIAIRDMSGPRNQKLFSISTFRELRNHPN